MKKSLSILVVVFSLILIGGNQIHAAVPEWKFDPDHSRFYFTIDHIYSKVIGYFEDFSGTFYFDPDNLEKSKINIEIKAKSINTNIRKRDNHLRSDDFFEVKKYPLITFESKSISLKEGNQYDVQGDLTIKDVTKSLVLPLTYFGTRDNPLQKGEVVAGFETRFSLNRLDYHVGSGKFYQMGVVGKNVDITVSLEMLRQK